MHSSGMHTVNLNSVKYLHPDENGGQKKGLIFIDFSLKYIWQGNRWSENILLVEQYSEYNCLTSNDYSLIWMGYGFHKIKVNNGHKLCFLMFLISFSMFDTIYLST